MEVLEKPGGGTPTFKVMVIRDCEANVSKQRPSFRMTLTLLRLMAQTRSHNW